MVKVGIAGGSGYGGVELIHILLRHPHAELTWISSQQHAGKKLEEVYPHLRKFLDIRFSALEEVPASQLDVLFLALPQGEAMKLVPGLPQKLVIIDLSGDFRIADPRIFEEFYHFPLSCPQEQKAFVYGLTELNREKIRAARRIANPGCFATATLLALYPLFQENWIKGPVFVDTKTGSSGAGNSPGDATHHPRRANSLFAYKPFTHQHLPEITQALERPDYPLIFQTHSAPFVRGIFASHYVELAKSATVEEIAKLYESYYAADFFIRWLPGCPDVNLVRHSNFVDIGAATQNGFLIVWSVLDNLQKGAAGQAVQNMNLICGFREETALDLPPVHP
ncbi:N-acetyl-gamma-glutamyl-phosphate reductase [Acidobacteria bacterium AH-259-L09]|nr:N-acetyl-gamma-glutamyl-phosphate reductase [Acidobacteria bacterium AH-259-L09]